MEHVKRSVNKHDYLRADGLDLDVIGKYHVAFENVAQLKSMALYKIVSSDEGLVRLEEKCYFGSCSGKG